MRRVASALGISDSPPVQAMSLLPVAGRGGESIPSAALLLDDLSVLTSNDSPHKSIGRRRAASSAAVATLSRLTSFRSRQGDDAAADVDSSASGLGQQNAGGLVKPSRMSMGAHPREQDAPRRVAPSSLKARAEGFDGTAAPKPNPNAEKPHHRKSATLGASTLGRWASVSFMGSGDDEVSHGSSMAVTKPSRKSMGAHPREMDAPRRITPAARKRQVDGLDESLDRSSSLAPSIEKQPGHRKSATLGSSTLARWASMGRIAGSVDDNTNSSSGAKVVTRKPSRRSMGAHPREIDAPRRIAPAARKAQAEGFDGLRDSSSPDKQPGHRKSATLGTSTLSRWASLSFLGSEDDEIAPALAKASRKSMGAHPKEVTAPRRIAPTVRKAQIKGVDGLHESTSSLTLSEKRSGHRRSATLGASSLMRWASVGYIGAGEDEASHGSSTTLKKPSRKSMGAHPREVEAPRRMALNARKAQAEGFDALSGNENEEVPPTRQHRRTLSALTRWTSTGSVIGSEECDKKRARKAEPVEKLPAKRGKGWSSSISNIFGSEATKVEDGPRKIPHIHRSEGCVSTLGSQSHKSSVTVSPNFDQSGGILDLGTGPHDLDSFFALDHTACRPNELESTFTSPDYLKASMLMEDNSVVTAEEFVILPHEEQQREDEMALGGFRSTGVGSHGQDEALELIAEEAGLEDTGEQKCSAAEASSVKPVEQVPVSSAEIPEAGGSCSNEDTVRAEEKGKIGNDQFSGTATEGILQVVISMEKAISISADLQNGGLDESLGAEQHTELDGTADEDERVRVECSEVLHSTIALLLVEMTASAHDGAGDDQPGAVQRPTAEVALNSFTVDESVSELNATDSSLRDACAAALMGILESALEFQAVPEVETGPALEDHQHGSHADEMVEELAEVEASLPGLSVKCASIADVRTEEEVHSGAISSTLSHDEERESGSVLADDSRRVACDNKGDISSRDACMGVLMDILASVGSQEAPGDAGGAVVETTSVPHLRPSLEDDNTSFARGEDVHAGGISFVLPSEELSDGDESIAGADSCIATLIKRKGDALVDACVRVSQEPAEEIVVEAGSSGMPSLEEGAIKDASTEAPIGTTSLALSYDDHEKGQGANSMCEHHGNFAFDFCCETVSDEKLGMDLVAIEEQDATRSSLLDNTVCSLSSLFGGLMGHKTGESKIIQKVLPPESSAEGGSALAFIRYIKIEAYARYSGVTWYEIDLQLCDGQRIMVSRRYRDFDRFKEHLNARGVDWLSSLFPQKGYLRHMIIPAQNVECELRRVLLQKWLQEVTGNAAVNPLLRAELCNFLGIH